MPGIEANDLRFGLGPSEEAGQSKHPEYCHLGVWFVSGVNLT